LKAKRSTATASSLGRLTGLRKLSELSRHRQILGLSLPAVAENLNAENVVLVKDSYIAPWALPKEQFPFHLLWEKSELVDGLRISLSPGLELGDCLNVTSMKDLGANEEGWFRYLIADIHLPGYFSGVASFSHIPLASSEGVNILVEFLAGAQVLASKQFQTKIIRPVISSKGNFQKLEITDGVPASIILPLIHEGEGVAEIDVDISSVEEGQVRKDDLLDKVLRQIQEASGDSSDSVEEMKANLHKLSNIVSKKKSGKFTDADAIEYQQFLQELEEDMKGDNGKKDSASMSRDVEALWIASVLDQIKKTPTEHVRLKHGQIEATIPGNSTALEFSINYKDAIGNSYEPVKISIPVDDGRISKNKEFEIIIGFEWFSEALV
jgi:hypothetical protein